MCCVTLEAAWDESAVGRSENYADLPTANTLPGQKSTCSEKNVADTCLPSPRTEVGARRLELPTAILQLFVSSQA
jgi:propanediol dehydratase small subunit